MRPSCAITAIATAALGLTACEAPKPKEHLELVELETYWAVERSAGEIQYLAPIARVVIKNRKSEPSSGIQATATFRRVSEPNETWGSAFEQVAHASSPLAGGESMEMFIYIIPFRGGTVHIWLRAGC